MSMNSITDFLMENWDRLALGQYGRPPLSTVVLTPGFRASSNVIELVFCEGKAEPALVAKVSRLPGDHSDLRSEAANLEKIQRARQQGFDSIPRLITLNDEEDHAFLVETMLTGSLMNPSMIRRQGPACIDAVMDWLIELGAATASPSGLHDGWFGRLVAEPVDRLRNAVPLEAEEDELLVRSWDAVLPLAQCDLPLVFEHGDASDPNLLTLNDGSLGVVDWELAQANSLPAVDVFFFLAYVAFSQRRAKKPPEYLAAFDQAFFGPSAWAVPYVLRYAHKVGISQEALTPLFILCWVRYLAKLHKRLNPGRSEVLPTETRAWLRANRYYSLWKHAVERVHQLNWHESTKS